MFGLDADGLHDRLTDFSRPVTGAFYFAPPLSLLVELADRWGSIEVGEPPPGADELTPRYSVGSAASGSMGAGASSAPPGGRT